MSSSILICKATGDSQGFPVKGIVVCVAFLLLSVLLFTSCITPSIRVTKEQNRGDELFNDHKYDEAIVHYRQMLEASKKLGIYRNISMESEVYRKIANGYEMMGNYEAAMKSVSEAISLDSVNNSVPDLIEDYRHEGRIYIYMGSYFNGIRSLEKSLMLGEGKEQSLKNTNRLPVADTYLALGQLYSVMGRSDEASEYTNKALGIFRQASYQKGEMEAYLTIATILSDQGDMPAARGFTDRSMKIASDLKMGTSRHNQLLATISSSMGEYEAALRYQQKALDEAGKLGIAAQVIWATIGLGDIYSELGDLVQAGKYYNAAKEARDTITIEAGSLDASLGLRMGDVSSANRYFSSQGSETGKGISSFRMAQLMMQKENPDSAIILLDDAALSFKRSGNVQGLARVQVLKGSIYIDNGTAERAESELDSALKTTEFPETAWQAWYHKGRLYENLGMNQRAIESYRNSVDIIEKIRGNLTIDEFKSTFFDSKREVYDRLINALLKNERHAEAFQVSEQARARAFYDILANRKIDFRGSLPGDLVSMEQEKRLEMQKLYLLIQRGDRGEGDPDRSSAEDLRQLKDALTNVQGEYESILRQIKLSNPAYAEIVSADPVSLSDLQSQLDSTMAVMSFWISDHELISWLVTKNGTRGKKVSIITKELNAMIEGARRAIQSNSSAEADALLSRLYQLTVEPYEIDLGKISTLIIIPNGALHFLPFQALKNRDGNYLVESYNLVYSPSASVYMICAEREAKAGSRFLGLALSDVIIENRPALPGTEDEVKKILPLFPDNMSAFGSTGTETFVKNIISGFNFIHFATHGSYNYRQPLYSYLMFPASDEDDGRLNVYEVFEMSINSKLVTLSACETGLGNISQGDELTGLSRAFLFAGSSSVLVSLWAVADYPTSLLMTTFYGYLREHPVQEALTLAQRDVIKVFPEPQYWSSFILIGNGQVRID